MKKTILMQTPYVEIFLNKSFNNSIIIAKWKGYLTRDNVKTGCSFMTKYVKDHEVQKHLSIHRDLKILSDEVQDYLINEWFPEVEKVGLKKVGAVIADDIFAKASVDRVNKDARVKDLVITAFYSEEDCLAWLMSPVDK